MRTGRCSLVTACLVLTVWVGALGDAAAAVQTFRLETGDRSQAYGPFEFRTGSKVFFDGVAYTVIAESGGLSFKDARTGRTFGPFDFVLGRIVNIAGTAYTLVDVRTIEGVAPEPPAPAAARPPSPGTPAAGRPPLQYPASGAGGRGFAFGAELVLADSVLYDGRIAGVGSEPRVTLDRRKATAFLRSGIFTCSLSATWAGEWNGGVSGAPFTFENARFEDGQGWGASAAARDTVFRRGAWDVTAYGELSYASEALTLRYGRWTTAEVIVPGTNGTVVTIPTFNNVEQDVTLTEWVVRVGLLLGYEGDGWSCYAGVEGIPVAETTLDATIATDSRAFDIELDQSYPVSVVGGIELDAMGFTFYVRGKAGEEGQVAVGGWREF